MTVTEEQRLKVIAASAEVRAALAELELANQTLNAFIEKIDKKRKLRNKVESAQQKQAAYNLAAGKMNAVTEEIRTALGLETLEGYRFSPETGEVTFTTPSSCAPEEPLPSAPVEVASP